MKSVRSRSTIRCLRTTRSARLRPDGVSSASLCSPRRTSPSFSEPLQHLPGRRTRDAEHLRDPRGKRERAAGLRAVLADRKGEEVDRLQVLVDRVTLSHRFEYSARGLCKVTLTTDGRRSRLDVHATVARSRRACRLTIFLGLPIGRIRTTDVRLKAALSATATGILLFLLYEVLAHGVGPVGRRSRSSRRPEVWLDFAGLAALFAAGTSAGLMSLVYPTAGSVGSAARPCWVRAPPRPPSTSRPGWPASRRHAGSHS